MDQPDPPQNYDNTPKHEEPDSTSASSDTGAEASEKTKPTKHEQPDFRCFGAKTKPKSKAKHMITVLIVSYVDRVHLWKGLVFDSWGGVLYSDLWNRGYYLSA